MHFITPLIRVEVDGACGDGLALGIAMDVPEVYGVPRVHHLEARTPFNSYRSIRSKSRELTMALA